MIESKDNQRFKNWMKLKLKKHRDSTGLFLVYGSTLVDLAKSKDIIDEIITSNPNYEGTLISDKLMKDLSQTETTHDIMAVCKKIEKKLISKNILVLDDVQNPDNVGALLRSASAFGFKHIILSKKSADLYNEKTIRASGGSIFDLFVERLIPSEFIDEMKNKGYQAFGADAHESENKPVLDKPYILVLGNESKGLSEEVKKTLNGLTKINIEDVESLNVAVAGSILMYEWSLKR